MIFKTLGHISVITGAARLNKILELWLNMRKNAKWN